MKIHRVDVRAERSRRSAIVPARFEIDEVLGMDGVQIVRKRSVVLALKEIVARRLARRHAGRSVYAAEWREVVARAELGVEKRPADRRDGHVAVVVEVGRAQ